MAENEPVSVTLNRQAALLLAKCAADSGSEDATGVLVRALGLLEMALRQKRQGGRLCFINEHGEAADVVF